MRIRGRVDLTQKPIVKALRDAGVTVTSLANIGRGCPDVLAGYQLQTFLLELKTEKHDKLTPDEDRFHREWRGRPVAVVRTPEEALRIVGVPVAEIAAILGSAQLVGTAP
jgi:Holliday junction resolvase